MIGDEEVHLSPGGSSANTFQCKLAALASLVECLAQT